MAESKINPQVVYGIHAVEELVQHNPLAIDKIYFTDKQKKGGLFELMKVVKKRKISYANIPEGKLNKMAGYAPHQGVVAFRTVRNYDDESVLYEKISEAEKPLILIPAGLEDPGNFGAIIRSAAAFNVSAILLERKGTVPLNATVAKTSAGMIEQMTLIKPRNLEETLIKLKDLGFIIFGADGSGPTPPRQLPLDKPCVIITGNEHAGIPAYLAKLCDEFASIPIMDTVESLNVSVAAGIMLYEAMVQRA